MTISSSCLPTRSGGGQSASSSFVISLSSIILFNSSVTLLCTYASFLIMTSFL
uniref:Uncharacterized protein n=1 Tax=Anguilla anguilla TaxID=7936 RepID=A0A0E9PZI0_ANGAN